MATREPKERRPHVWTARVFIALLIVVPAAPWYVFGFEKHYVSAQIDYDTIESMGFPLDQESFFQHYRVPADQNNGEELTKALVSFAGKVRELDSRLAKSGKAMRFPLTELMGIDYLSVKPGQTPPTAKERLAAFDLVRPYLNEIRAKSAKPYYVVREVQVFDVDYSYSTDLAVCGELVKLSCEAAKLLAALGRRVEAVEQLQFAVHLSNLVASFPEDWRIATGYNLKSRISQAALLCAKADPGGASEYLSIRSHFKLPPKYAGLNSELVRLMDLYRETSSTEFINDMTHNSVYGILADIRAEVNPDGQLPDSKLIRAWAGYTLKQWLPIMRELNRDGTAKDIRRMNDALSHYRSTSATNRGLISAAHNHLIFSATIDTVENSEVGMRKRALHFGAIRVIDYKHRQGNWPKTLAEARVEPIELGGSVEADFGYQVTSGSVWMWIKSEIGPTPNFASGEGSHLVDLARKTPSRP